MAPLSSAARVSASSLASGSGSRGFSARRASRRGAAPRRAAATSGLISEAFAALTKAASVDGGAQLIRAGEMGAKSAIYTAVGGEDVAPAIENLEREVADDVVKWEGDVQRLEASVDPSAEWRNFLGYAEGGVQRGREELGRALDVLSEARHEMGRAVEDLVSGLIPRGGLDATALMDHAAGVFDQTRLVIDEQAVRVAAVAQDLVANPDVAARLEVAQLKAEQTAAAAFAALASFSAGSALSESLGDDPTALAVHAAEATAAALLLGVIVSASRGGKKAKSAEQTLPMRYDAQASADYFASRPYTVLRRGLEILSASVGFAAALLWDRRRGKEEENRPKRAEQALELVTRLGPTFIKVGQALSIRVDLLAPEYIASLRELQDRVPAFPSDEAFRIIEAEIGMPLDQAFSEFSPQPVAAASLGQVYRARVRDTGEEVAVKVQRPNTLEGIALDLHLIRLFVPYFKEFNDLNTDFIGLVDEWGAGFVDELDYRREAENSRVFQEAMDARSLTAVTTAVPVDALCSRRILTTAWVDGERLEESSAGDVARLCGVALNAYLTMLLDTGCLHADPHPGNLMRTRDGRLCILDWGLVTNITREQQYTIIEYIAHLVSQDYASIPRDLVALGFVPEGKEALVEEAGVVRVLSTVLRQLASGGGAASLNVDQLIGELSSMTREYGNLFRVPPYFAYILRSFSVLEGVGLQADPGYAIVQECYPYLAKRLFTDNNPRAQAALQDLLYSDSNSDKDTEAQLRQRDTRRGTLNVKRLAKLARSFQSYSVSTRYGSVSGGQGAKSARSATAASPTSSSTPSGSEAGLAEIAAVLFSEEGNYVQDVMLEETARAIDALVREAAERVLGHVSPLGTLAESMSRGAREEGAIGGAWNPLATGGPLAPLLFPLTVPLTMGDAAVRALRKSPEDEDVLATLRQLAAEVEDIQKPLSGDARGAAQQQLPTLPSPNDMRMGLDALGPLLPGIAATGLRLNARLLNRAASRLAEASRAGPNDLPRA